MTDIKTQARRLHQLLNGTHGLNLTYSQVLHLLAQSHGLSSWQELKARMAPAPEVPAAPVTVLTQPYTTRELRALQDADPDNHISGVVQLDLDTLVDTCSSGGFEGFLNFISEELTGSDLLMDVSYDVVGADGNLILVEVTGDPTSILDANEDDTDDAPEDTP